ncbi:MAG: T9SS type A sorting domain-containing protein [Saprospirales bacterium]|nr:T9SS type A sorting domain-containing protein [Saprospirales bacterium]
MDQRRDQSSIVPPGLYFIELNNGQHSITKRIIKQ